MKGILADANIQGHFDRLLHLMATQPWLEFWGALGLAALHFSDIGLDPKVGDRVMWHLCQAHELVLSTGNRNAHGPDSLEETIRRDNTPTSLPVLTLADPDRVFHEGDYAERVIGKLVDVLERIDSLRGTGRLYLP